MAFPILGSHAERGLVLKTNAFTIAYRENYCEACGERINGEVDLERMEIVLTPEGCV